ncbi:undecaprenyl-phosphate glucose phosphotransferase [Chitinophaga solisilvae]|uniref:Undecaprenyl-phosphate glucose phosphotransferase n=1 Tax=Chitinophaga solisilvae TaxID=1233460 RepID=A0A433WNS6_9BACT|nr:undecaprenyl-phosphate glucose phosphotransferase [Chitinophaga solisilvae]NSL85360.1 undecaprenyl-phosphate glucose phosphotransferase [Chitinophaga solisilvae]
MRQILNASLFLRQLMDYAVLAGSFWLAQQYIHVQGNAAFLQLNLLLLMMSLLSWTIIGTYLHLYDDFRSRPFSYEFVVILKTILLHVCVLTFLFFYFFKYYPYSRTFTVVYSINIFVGIIISKLLIKKFLLRLRMHGHNTRNILIVGAGETGLNFHQTIIDNEHYGYRCVGFVDDIRNKQLNGQYLGTLSELKQILEKHEVDDVVVALPESSREQTQQIITTSEGAAKRVRIIAGCHHHCTTTVSMSLFGTFPLITIRSSPLDDSGRQQLKRLFDIFITITLLITFSWLFLLIALLIKISSRGPVIYKQERWGLKNQRLTCYKFRTMVPNSEWNSSGQFMLTMRNDPRITLVGRFLRKTNLDELPQFINVLKGDMSFVGPRPLATAEHMELKEKVSHYMVRHYIKPGITGWAQINGCRGNLSDPEQMQKRINLDIWYLENYSLWLDCQIIFQTFVSMIKGDRNAF